MQMERTHCSPRLTCFNHQRSGGNTNRGHASRQLAGEAIRHHPAIRMANDPDSRLVDVVLCGERRDQLIKESNVVDHVVDGKGATPSGVPRLRKTFFETGSIRIYDDCAIIERSLHCLLDSRVVAHRLGVATKTVQDEEQRCWLVTREIYDTVRPGATISGVDGVVAGRRKRGIARACRGGGWQRSGR